MSVNSPYANKFLVIVNIRDKVISGAICPMLRVFADLKSATDYYDKIRTDKHNHLDSLYLVEGTLWRTKVFSGMGAVIRDEDFDTNSTAP